MATATPLTYQSTVFWRIPVRIQSALYLALGFSQEDIYHYDTPFDLHDAMHTRIGSLKAVIAAGGELYETTAPLLYPDNDFVVKFRSGLMRCAKRMLKDLAHVLMLDPTTEFLNVLKKHALIAIVIKHIFNLVKGERRQRFKAEYHITEEA